MLLRTLSGAIPVGVALLAIVASPDQPVEEGNYAGSATCRLCHPRQHTSWAATRHERAFELLENSGKTSDDECFPCHTTGHGRPSGFTDPEATPGLKGIQCEACHGPGENHANAAGDKSKITRVPPATVCTRCHMKFSIHELSTE
jgi:hypothetical protein